MDIAGTQPSTLFSFVNRYNFVDLQLCRVLVREIYSLIDSLRDDCGVFVMAYAEHLVLGGPMQSHKATCGFTDKRSYMTYITSNGKIVVSLNLRQMMMKGNHAERVV